MHEGEKNIEATVEWNKYLMYTEDLIGLADEPGLLNLRCRTFNCFSPEALIGLSFHLTHCPTDSQVRVNEILMLAQKRKSSICPA